MRHDEDDPFDYVLHGDGPEAIAILTFPHVDPPFLSALAPADRELATALLGGQELGEVAALLGTPPQQLEERVMTLLRALNMDSVRQLIVSALWHSVSPTDEC